MIFFIFFFVSLRISSRSPKRKKEKMSPRDFGVVFDIDGVLLRGEDLIPGSREAVLKVSARAAVVFELGNGKKRI